MKKLLLIDGFSALFRAYYAVPMLINAEGEAVNAVYGFISILQKNLEEEAPDFIKIAFDSKTPTFRHEIFPEYKGERQAPLENFDSQIPLVISLLEKMNLSVVSVEGFEADDIIATFVNNWTKKGGECVILTGDHDLFQLASEQVCVKTPLKGEKALKYFAKDVLEKYGVSPSKFTDMKALMGDSSDNIPGIPGIGEKNASRLIKEYGDIESILEAAPKMKPSKISRNLIDYAEQARLYKKIIILQNDVPVDFEFTPYVPANIWNSDALEELRRLRFFSIIKRIKTPIRVNKKKESDVPLFDVKKNDSLILVFKNYEPAQIKDLYTDEPKAFRDLKAALEILPEAPKNTVFDMRLSAYLLGESIEIEQEELAYLQGRIKAAKLNNLLETEIELAYILRNMELKGVKTDAAKLIEFGERMSAILNVVEEKIYGYAGEKFLISSPKQLGEILFERLELPPSKKNKTGYSTAAEVLDELSDKHPIIALIQEYRFCSKLKSTYVDGLLPLIAEDGRIHPTFNQTLTTTGRISCSEPNLQNIPVRTKLGRELRRAFIPEEGALFIDADYSQIELRVLAHLSSDKALCEAFNDNRDVHAITAAQVFGVKETEVSQSMRSAAKAVNFGIIYGISAFGLSRDLNIPVFEAQEYIYSYLRKYEGVEAYMRTCVARAKETGYAETEFGRRRFIQELYSRNFAERQFGERAAMNMPIQGFAADIMKIAMTRVHKRLERDAFIVMQAHDELLIEAEKKYADEVCSILTYEMKNAVKLKVPLEAEAKTGDSWFTAK